MITSLYLDEQNFNDYDTINNDRCLKDFSKINIFIGANNSGKSRLLRSFFSKSNINFTLDDFDIMPAVEIISGLKETINEKFKDVVNNDYGNIKAGIFPTFHSSEYISQEFDFTGTVINPLNSLRSTQVNHGTSGLWNGTRIAEFVKGVAQNAHNQIESLGLPHDRKFKLDNIYIPTLRGLRNLAGNSTNPYLERTKKDYFNNEGTDQKIFTGLTFYNDAKTRLLGPKHGRDLVKNFEIFLSETFFNNKEVNIIPNIDDDVVHIRIGNEEYPIFKLGDGIQSIIILTYPLFFNQDRDLGIFIEEPEHYLHPGLQRTFIETLLRPEFERFQFFITTHSNHLLDITLDFEKISIYTFKKGFNENHEPHFIIENVENEDSDILKTIGVRNSSVFLSNCTIWVEGITDRIYLRKYIDLFQRDSDIQFKEDIHYTFVEYGGNNITHWSFLNSEDSDHPNIQVERLCGKSFLIADNDGINQNPNSKKARRNLELQQRLKDRYYGLNSREIENTLALPIIKSVLIDYAGSNASNLNFKRAFDEKNLKTQPLGKFIESSVEGLYKKFAAESGTLKDKLNFAKKAVGKLKRIEDLSQEAILLTEKIYNFIKENNFN